MRTPPVISTYSRRAARTHARRRSTRRVALIAISCALLAGAVAAGAWAGGLWPRSAGRADTAATVAQEAAPASGEASVAASDAPAAAPAPVPAAPATITVSAVGDMIFDRNVEQLIKARGGTAPLAKMSSHLSRADIALGNLESNLSASGAPQAGKDVTFRGHPAAIEGLKAAGFDFVALGNNHVLDYGPQSLQDTLTALDAAGIGHSGAGMNRAQAWTPAVVERDGATVAFLSFSHILPPGFVATDSKAGLARGRGNMDAVAAAISAAKAQYDYVIASFHWGVEYKDVANGDQVRDARRAVDAGADLVLSHHPHVIQGIEFYKQGLIAYSLGDFVFDHYSRKTGEAFVLDLELGPAGVSNVVATPVYLDKYGAPAIVTGSEASVILQRLAKISAPHGAAVVQQGDVAQVTP